MQVLRTRSARPRLLARHRAAVRTGHRIALPALALARIRAPVSRSGRARCGRPPRAQIDLALTPASPGGASVTWDPSGALGARPTGNCRVRRAALLFLDLKEHTRRVSLRLLVPEWGPRWLLARLPQLVELGAEHPELSLGDAEQLPVVRAVSSAGQCGRSRQHRIEEQRY